MDPSARDTPGLCPCFSFNDSAQLLKTSPPRFTLTLTLTDTLKKRRPKGAVNGPLWAGEPKEPSLTLFHVKSTMFDFKVKFCPKYRQHVFLHLVRMRGAAFLPGRVSCRVG